MRILASILGLLVVIGGLAGVKYKQIASLISAGKQFQQMGPPPEHVGSATAQAEAWGGTLDAVGSVAAGKGVSISNEVAGTVTRIAFESGDQVKQGQVLVELDTSVERAQLASILTRKELATTNAERSRALFGTNTIPRATLDQDESALKTTSADAVALQTQIDRKTVRAPFSGRLGIRNVNLGQYLTPGTQLTVLEDVTSVYIDFTLPQQELAAAKVGMPVHAITDDAKHDSVDGTIAAIDPTIDSAARTIKLRAAVPNKTDLLRPGMFVNVSVVLPESGSVVAVPASALVHAAYGDSVYVVEASKDDPAKKVARQQFVRLGEARGDFVAITDGITAGQEVVTSGAFKLRNGAGVVVDNSVQPTPSLDPHPENR